MNSLAHAEDLRSKTYAGTHSATGLLEDGRLLVLVTCVMRGDVVDLEGDAFQGLFLLCCGFQSRRGRYQKVAVDF